MRKLNSKQKDILRHFPNIMFSEDLPSDTYEQLESLNDYETLEQDVNRFLSDQYLQKHPGHYFANSIF